MATDQFPYQLRRARELAGLSLRELSARTRRPRIHFTRISLIERGIEPRADEVRALAAVLGPAIAKAIGGRHAA